MHIDQFLHGYNNGHHLIASSASLPLKDADRMSYLSDWSGYVNPYNKDTSYITAYPLTESNSYVIAMSWYADEMSRPGCVWTHSLVVNFEALGQRFNFCDLLRLFKRPKKEGEDFLTYTKAIELDDDRIQEERRPMEGIDMTRFMFMSALLLDGHKPAVYAVEKESDVYIELCMRLVQNLPYGMLKELSVCSGSGTIRRIENGFYNLQFVTGKGESLMEPFPSNASKPKADAGFQFWMDTVLSGRNDVAQMLHRFSDDIGNDSNKFLATLNLLRLLDQKLNGSTDVPSFQDVIFHLVKGFREIESGSLLKRSFLSEQVSKLFCDEKTYIYTLATTSQSESFNYDEIGYKDRVWSFRNTSGVDEYVTLLEELCKADFLNAEGSQLLSSALDGLSKEDSMAIIRKDWSLFKSILTMNNQVLVDDFWIDLEPSQFLSLFTIFQKNIPAGFEDWERLYRKILTIDTFVADDVLSEFALHIERYVQIALDKWNSLKSVPINKAILKYCFKQQSKVITWMSQQESISDELRISIKQNIKPDDSIVVRMGSIAWQSFVRCELNSQNNANELVYIYVLAFNWQDYNALYYIKGVLPYIYEALSTESLSYSAWKRIERFTGNVPFWRSWDNCRKVLIGVKDYCKAMSLSIEEIENFTTNQKLNRELIELWKKG